MRLQKRVKEFVLRKRAVREYMDICPLELSEADTANVKQMLARYGPFVYSSVAEEEEMNMKMRESRPMTRL